MTIRSSALTWCLLLSLMMWYGIILAVEHVWS
jgi:hypothetical protein